jgi:hypothetical protein
MKEILEIGGKGFLIPTVLSVVMLYAAKGLFTLHDWRAQHRKAFLELWDQTRQQDDLWLEVAVRQWLGHYLPAHVIRLAMSHPDKAQSLIELSDLWPLLRYDRDTRKVKWLHLYSQNKRWRIFYRLALFVGYFVCGVTAILFAISAAQRGPDVLSGWLYGAGAVFLGISAFGCLAHGDTVKVAPASGDAWIMRINQSVDPPRARTKP